MWYLTLKHLHVTCVALSITLFVGRAVAQFSGLDWRRWRILRVLPHLIDTVLLASAIGLAWFLRQAPFVHDWLTAKVLALVAYIILGALALRPNQPTSARAGFFALAVIVFGYIVMVALKRNPWPFA